jgi:hypothetical protein
MNMSTIPLAVESGAPDGSDAAVVSAAPTKVKTPSTNKPAKKAASKKPLAKPWVDSLARPAAPPTAKAVVAKPAAPKKVAKSVKPVESTKPAVVAKPKAKLVRDSFTMPQGDFDLINTLKDRALGFKRPTKKSELLRAGLQVLAGLSPDALKAALGRLAPLKAGRPKKAD